MTLCMDEGTSHSLQAQLAPPLPASSFTLLPCLPACHLLSACLSVCLSVSLSVCLPVCWSVCLSVYMCVYLPTCLRLSLSVCLHVCPSVCPRACLLAKPTTVLGMLRCIQGDDCLTASMLPLTTSKGPVCCVSRNSILRFLHAFIVGGLQHSRAGHSVLDAQTQRVGHSASGW